MLVFVARRDADGWHAVAATNVNETAHALPHRACTIQTFGSQ